jgi:hypothetical protein
MIIGSMVFFGGPGCTGGCDTQITTPVYCRARYVINFFQFV